MSDSNSLRFCTIDMIPRICNYGSETFTKPRRCAMPESMGKILLVEDSQIAREAARREFVNGGFSVLAYSHAQFARLILENASLNFSALIVDIVTDEDTRTGLKLAEEVRAKGCKLPIILMSGTRPPDIPELLDRGSIQAFWEKDASGDWSELVELVKKLLA